MEYRKLEKLSRSEKINSQEKNTICRIPWTSLKKHFEQKILKYSRKQQKEVEK
jgi:hypothetical protein